MHVRRVLDVSSRVPSILRGPLLWCVLFWGAVPISEVNGQVGLPPFINYGAAREQLIREVIIPGGVTDERVIESIRNTARHEFVPLNVRNEAYYDRALPIGSSQTISSPLIVSIMTQELQTDPQQKVLEIGTGSGFQAAVLSPLVKEVYSIEIVPELGAQARKVLDALGYQNVFTKVGDGFLGWEEHAPFDRVIVTCSPEKVPQPLIDQLAEGGLMVIPVGERYQQTLYLMRKKDGKLERESLRPTLFVPMTGEAEERRKVHADPSKPELVNGGFNEQPSAAGVMPGWYYERGVVWEEADDAPEGKNFVTFRNEVQGRPTNLLQGVALDGRQVKRIKLSASVKCSNVKPGIDPDELPAVAIRFFDEQRSLLGTQWLGTFRGSRNWRAESRVFRVPDECREAIISIGLFGATGEASFDDIRLEAVAVLP